MKTHTQEVVNAGIPEAEQYSYSASDKFSEFIKETEPYKKGIYNGVKNIVSGYAENGYTGDDYKNKADVASGVTAKFLGGFLGSVVSDQSESYLKKIGSKFGNKFISYALPKAGGVYSDALSSGIAEDFVKNSLTGHLSFDSFLSSVGTHVGIYEKKDKGELIPDGVLILYLSILSLR